MRKHKRSVVNIVLFILLLWAESISAREVTLAWDANPIEDEVAGYYVYLKNNSGGYDRIATVAGTSATITLPNGVQFVVVTAYNGLESLPSDELRVPNKPGKPTGLRITGGD